jgi:hypothetical protein
MPALTRPLMTGGLAAVSFSGAERGQTPSENSERTPVGKFHTTVPADRPTHHSQRNGDGWPGVTSPEMEIELMARHKAKPSKQGDPTNGKNASPASDPPSYAGGSHRTGAPKEPNKIPKRGR